jgi:hypothetical protein
MTHHTLLAALAAVCLAAGPGDETKPQAAKTTLNDLSLEVAALQTLYQFKLTPEQLKAVRHLAKETVDADGNVRHAAKGSEALRKALQSLRDALARADDPDKIAELQDAVEDLRGKEDPELDEGVEITDAARRRAPELLRRLSARQVAAYLSTYGEEAPDPLESLLEAIDSVRGLNAEDWKALRQDLADQVGRLVGGLDADKANAVGDKAVQLLIRVRALKDAEFKEQRAELEKEARDLVGNVGPLDVLRHLAEYALAELLSNPRLAHAVAARLQ